MNCETCDGTGKLTDPNGAFPGDRITFPCDDCQGTGVQIWNDPIRWHWEQIADDLWEMSQGVDLFNEYQLGEYCRP